MKENWILGRTARHRTAAAAGSVSFSCVFYGGYTGVWIGLTRAKNISKFFARVVDCELLQVFLALVKSSVQRLADELVTILVALRLAKHPHLKNKSLELSGNRFQHHSAAFSSRSSS